MGVREKHGREKTENGIRYRTSSVQEIVHTIAELAGICAESARAGGDAWYEVTVYVHPHGLLYQVQRRGSVVGGSDPAASMRTLRQSLNTSGHQYV